MFYISVTELALTCLLALAFLFVPFLFKRYYANFERRLRNVEKQLEKK